MRSTNAVYRHLHLWIVPNCGHATLQDHAPEFNQQAETFFQAKAILTLLH